MKVIEHLEAASGPLISFEIIPPRRGGSLAELLGVVEDLVRYRPPFIDITSHAAEAVYQETASGLRKRVIRKRPGTMGLSALIQNKFGIDAVPHVLCEGFTREETEDFLIELHYLGIDNVLAVRGDRTNYEKPLESGRSRNRYATDLIAQISDMNRGIFLEDVVDASPTEFCIGAAGYPEKHVEAPNLMSDVRRVRQKVEAGACYIVSQMFFDNPRYFEFVDLCRAEGIDVPIIPGLKVLTSKRQVTSLPRIFNCDIPPELAEAVDGADSDHVLDVGVAWTLEQAAGLLEWGAPALHFYVKASSEPINRVMAGLDV